MHSFHCAKNCEGTFLERMVYTANGSMTFTSKDTKKIRFNFLKNKESKTYTCSTSSSIIITVSWTRACTDIHEEQKTKTGQKSRDGLPSNEQYDS